MRLTSPSFARNFTPITDVLAPRLPSAGRVLEVASGPGQHICAWAERFPALTWEPSDVSEAARASVASYVSELGLSNVATPRAVDLGEPAWEADFEPGFAAIVGVNVLHISPWAASEGLLRGAGKLLSPSGHLFVYGPFMRSGAHTASSNEAFDQSLRGRNPDWGVRDMDALDAHAKSQGLSLVVAEPMPSNNFVLVFSTA